MRYIYQSHFVDGNGSVVLSGTVNVYLTGTSTVATIYDASSGGSAISGGQLTTSSTDGSFSFWVDISDYDTSQQFRIVLSKTGYATKTYDNIVVFQDKLIPTYTELKAIDPVDGLAVTVGGRDAVGDGGEGVFVGDTDNLSSDVTADTEEGFYVPPDSDTTGSSGAWVRIGRQVHPEQFGANGGADDTTGLQAAFDFATAYGYPLVQTQSHNANVTIGGKINWDGNNNALTPVADDPVITIDAGTQRTVLENISMNLGGVNRAWTDCDGIRIVGQGGTDDYTTLRNILVRGAPGYGLYAYGSASSGNTVQRLHVYDSTIVDSEYANVRLEGVVLETQWIGGFYNNGCVSGALPVVTDQSTHPESPAREFRRASFEILRWYSAADTGGTNDLTPNRVTILGANFANNEDNTGTSRTAGVYVSGCVSLNINGTNFENPYPAVWFAREDGTLANYSTSSKGAMLGGCTFKLSGTDANVSNPVIEWDGHSQVTIDTPVIQGDGGPTTDSFIHNNMQYAQAGMLETRNVDNQGVTFTNGIVNRESTAYSQIRLIANARYMAHVAGVNGVVVAKPSGSGSTNLHALSAKYNSLDTVFIDSMTVKLNADPTVDGTITVVHDADDGAAGVLAGKFALSGAVDATLDDIYKSIWLQWDAENAIWRELYRNF